MTASERDAETGDEANQERTIEAIQTSYELWANESAVKTEKLTLFFVAQSVLLTGFTLGNRVGQLLISIIGVAFSMLLYISMGRTDAYQTIWERRAKGLVEQASAPVDELFDLYPKDSEISEMPWYKRTGQSYILYPPIAGFFIWILLLVYIIYTNFL
jgi:hypothetical protein